MNLIFSCLVFDLIRMRRGNLNTAVRIGEGKESAGETRLRKDERMR